MDNLREIAAGFCGACSDDGSVFRNAFNRAGNGVETKPTISMTPAPDVGRPFNM